MVPGYRPAARRAASLKGGTNDVPLPSACNSPMFDVYGNRCAQLLGWGCPALA